MKGKPAPAKAKDQDAEVALFDDYEAILAAVIDEKYLLEVSGATSLKKIEYLNMQVDTTAQSLLELPDLLPSLKHLALDNSTIGSIRDLGVGLRCLLSLSLSSCGLYELDGIGVLTGLQELNLADNYISDVTPLAMHENLQNLNMTGNRVADLAFGDVLASCPKLRALFLTRNPVERAPSYRAIVAYLMPGIEMLDGLPLDASLSQRVNHSVLMEASSALKLLAEEQEYEQRLEVDILGSMHKSSSLVCKQSSATVRSTEKSLSLQPPLSSGAIGAAAMSGELIPDTGSELTHGSAVVLAGNAAMAIRKRRTGRVAPTPQICEEKEFESALDVLDNALHNGGDQPARNAAGSLSAQGLREGDITEVVTGSSSPFPHSRHLSVEPLTAEARKSGLELDMSTLGSAQRMPGSALPSSSARRATDKSALAPRSSSGRKDSPEETIAPFSPRQRNNSRHGSRPHSAAHPSAQPSSSAASSSSLMTSCFVPFVFGSPRSASGQGSDDEEEPLSARRALATKKGQEDMSGNAVLAKTRSTGASIVHLDIVKRLGQADANGVLEDIEDDERGSDAEDIAVTHRERLRLMSSTANNSNASLLKTRQGVLSKLRGTDTSAGVDSTSTATMTAPPRKLPPSSGAQTRLPPSSSSVRSVASKAGSSLGFNLAGSLAAIDQWVQDMASEDDSDDPSPAQKSGTSQLPLSGKKPAGGGVALNAFAKKACVRGLDGRREAEEDEQEKVMDSCEDEEEGEEEVERRPNSARILSRDAIFQLCAESRQGSRQRTAKPQASLSGPPLSTTSMQSGSCSLFLPSSCSSAESTPSSKRRVVASTEAPAMTPVPPPLHASSGESKKPSRPVDDQKAALMSKVSKKAMPSGQPQHASSLSDQELVELLRQPPKTIPMLRTKAGFQDFFRDLTHEHFQKLVSAAYNGIADAEDREAKINKRMEIMAGALRE